MLKKVILYTFLLDLRNNSLFITNIKSVVLFKKQIYTCSYTIIESIRGIPFFQVSEDKGMIFLCYGDVHGYDTFGLVFVNGLEVLQRLQINNCATSNNRRTSNSSHSQIELLIFRQFSLEEYWSWEFLDFNILAYLSLSNWTLGILQLIYLTSIFKNKLLCNIILNTLIIYIIFNIARVILSLIML